MYALVLVPLDRTHCRPSQIFQEWRTPPKGHAKLLRNTMTSVHYLLMADLRFPRPYGSQTVIKRPVWQTRKDLGSAASSGFRDNRDILISGKSKTSHQPFRVGLALWLEILLTPRLCYHMTHALHPSLAIHMKLVIVNRFPNPFPAVGGCTE